MKLLYVPYPPLFAGCFAARYRIKSEYGIVKDIRENSRGFYVIVDFV